MFLGPCAEVLWRPDGCWPVIDATGSAESGDTRVLARIATAQTPY